MAKKKLDFGGNINPQYINPIQSNNNIGKLQTTLSNNGMSGNLTSGGKLNASNVTGKTPSSSGGMGMGGVGMAAGVLGSQMEGSEAQNAISQMGPWGAIIGTASKMGTSLGDSIGGNTGGAIKGAFDPAGILMDKNLSMGKRIIGAGIPILGGIWASKAKKKAEAKAKAEQANKNMALDAQQRSSQMVDNTPDIAVMSYGGGIKGTTNIGNTKLLEYGGQTHEESLTGGTPVDANGQLTSMNNADALVEKDEVAWNKGKNNTYVFSNRLGFAREAKSIMKKYEKRLGKDLDGQDNISKNTMNMQLTNLENRQEAVKSQLQQPVINQMANGGIIPLSGIVKNLITDANKKIKKRIYETVQPSVYDTEELPGRVKNFITNNNRFEDKSKEYSNLSSQLKIASKARDQKKVEKLLKNIENLDNRNINSTDDPYSEDAWAMYLDQPQKNKTLTKSTYTPSISKTKSSNYYKLPTEFENELLDLYNKKEIKKGIINENKFSDTFGEGKSKARMLGNFTVDEGEDRNGKYLSYYDKYDLSPKLPILGKTNLDFIGTPYEIYNRIYINNKTKDKVLPNKANGGDITTTNSIVTPKPTFKYPETIEKFGSFKKDLEADPVAKDRARLYHYKQVLDPLLQAKDVKGYNEFTTNVPKAIKERVKLADTAYTGGKYKAYISPEEIQKTLGENYNDYIGLIDKFHKPALGIAGTNEKDKPVTDLNYGLRNSLSISPYGIVNVNKDQTTNELKSQFNADVMYNPKTKSYDYNYKEPKEFMCGGKIKKMARGGGIPYKGVEPFNMRTPSENLDYLGGAATNFLVGKKYKSNAPKGIGTYTGTVDSPIVDKVSKSKVAKDKSYLGDIVPIAGGTALSMAGTAYALNKLKKPKSVNLGRVTPQTISLESARESARQGAGDAMGNIRTAAKGVGSPNYMNEVIAGTVGTQRELGKNLTQSYLAEQTANAAAKESADKTNLAATAQETGMNLQQMDKYNDTKAGLTSNLFALPGMGVSEYLGQKNISDMTQLGSKYKFKTDPKNRFKRIMVANGDK